MDIGVYCIHSAVRFFGMPNDIKAFSTRLSNGFEDSGSVLMRYGHDMTVEAVYSKITAYVPEANKMVCEVREFLRLIENNEIDHKYLNYSLDAIRVIDEVRKQAGIRF